MLAYGHPVWNFKPPFSLFEYKKAKREARLRLFRHLRRDELPPCSLSLSLNTPLQYTKGTSGCHLYIVMQRDV